MHTLFDRLAPYAAFVDVDAAMHIALQINNEKSYKFIRTDEKRRAGLAERCKKRTPKMPTRSNEVSL